jgi:hypothetical protein
MKKYTLIIACCFLYAFQAYSQSAYILPSPTGKNDSITLFINVAQTTYTGLSERLTDHPDDDVYLWTWQPAGPVVGNGSWDNSNTAQKMTKVSDKLYKIRFLPTSYYNVDATQFFTLGISCLAKLKNGNEYSGDYSNEAKTEDLHITIIPRLCDELYCTFPEIAKTDDYLSITYDNTQETNTDLQGLGEDECYLFIRAEQSTFVAFNYATPELTTSTPALKMKPVPGKPGFFRLTILPSDFFSGIVPETFDMKRLKYYVLKPGYVYASGAPAEIFTFLDCQ